jgi:hypothetical protein
MSDIIAECVFPATLIKANGEESEIEVPGHFYRTSQGVFTALVDGEKVKTAPYYNFAAPELDLKSGDRLIFSNGMTVDFRGGE